MPVPHRARPSSTRAVRKKAPTPELTSDETLKFVSEVLKKQKKKKAGAVAKGVKPSRQQQPIKNSRSSAVKLASVVEDDHEPCAMWLMVMLVIRKRKIIGRSAHVANNGGMKRVQH